MPQTSIIHDVLAEHAFFGGLTFDERQRIIGLSRVQEVEEGRILFHHGDSYRGFYLVVKGQVEIARANEEGRVVVLHVIRAGESFAEVPLFEGHKDPRYPATATTLGDSELIFIPATPFLRYVESHPQVCLHMVGHMAQRLRRLVGRLEGFALHDVSKRLARYLIEHAKPCARNERATLHLDISKSVLAAELGTVPETLSRALRDLDDEGLIRNEGDAIIIVDRAQLENL